MQQSRPVIDSTEELQPLSNNEENGRAENGGAENGGAENVEEKKKKKKKKKKRANKTAPAPEETGDEPDGVLPPLAWNTPPPTLNGFPGSKSIGPRRLEPLAPLSGSKCIVKCCISLECDICMYVYIQVLPTGLFRTCLQVYTVEVRWLRVLESPLERLTSKGATCSR